MEKTLVFLGIEIIKQAPHLVLDLIALWKTNTRPTAAEVMKIFGDVDKSYADLIKDSVLNKNEPDSKWTA